MHTEDYFEEIGWVRYMKAVKEGGMDYGEYGGGMTYEQSYFDGQTGA